MLHVDSNPLSLTSYTVYDFAIQASLYLLASGSAYLLLFKSRFFKKQKLDPKPLPSRQVKSEIKHSLITLLFFAFSGGVTYALSVHTKIFHFYGDAEQYGWTYFFLSPLLYLILHDAYFYWTHRLLHHRRLFRIGHELHHRSYSPTPFTVYSFNFLESFLDSLYVPIAALFLPIHPAAAVIFLISSLFFNLVGHLGHELYPSWFFRSFLSKFMMTSTYHQFHHHGGPRTNFGFYFRFWDRLCGTEDPRYAMAIQKYAYPDSVGLGATATLAASGVRTANDTVDADVAGKHARQLTG